MDSITVKLLTTPVFGETTPLDLIVIVFIIIFAYIVGIIIKRQIRFSFSEVLSKADLELTTRIVQYLIYLLAILLILPRLSLDLSGLFVAGGIVALAIAFATQNLTSNLVSGLFLIFERPIKIGDSVVIDSKGGIIQDIQIMSTIMRGFDGVYHRIPNSDLFTKQIINNVINPVIRFEYTIGIRYQDDAEKAIDIIKKVIDVEPFVLINPAPALYVDKLDDSSVNIVVRIWAPSSIWWDLRTKLLWVIKVALEKNGIQIPFPQSEIWFNNAVKSDTGNLETSISIGNTMVGTQDEPGGKTA